MEKFHGLAAAIAAQSERRHAAAVLSSLPSGWRNVPSASQKARYANGDRELDIGYQFGWSGLTAEVDGVPIVDVHLVSGTGDGVELEIANLRRKYRVHRIGNQVFVDSSLGTTQFTELPRFPDTTAQPATGSLVAPMPGTVVRITVDAGDPVLAGAALVVLEAMKMEHTVFAPVDGIVGEILVAVGQAVESDTVLAVVTSSSSEEI